MDHIVKAINDYHRLRRRAVIEQIIARFTGKSTDLLSFEEVRRRVRANQQIERGLQDVPLDLIVGSVGRYKDFTRTFLPKENINQYRWANVKSLNLDMSGLPPVDLYKIGDVYFVSDGNHRVSVAREMGFPTIQAYVTELLTRVPLGAETSPDTLIIAEEYADFLEKTEIDRLRPGLDLRMSAPGRFSTLLDHIEVHRYFMGLDFKRDVSWQEAVTHWADTIYVPVINLIRERGLMNDFPERTPTDLYVWIAENQGAFEEKLGWELSPWETVEAISDLGRPGLQKLTDNIWAALEASNANDGNDQENPEPISEIVEAVISNRLFGDILVSLGAEKLGWPALEQAIIVAQKENGRLRAVHHNDPTNIGDRGRDHDEKPHHHFEQRLNETGVSGRIADVGGDWVAAMTDRARWADLVVISRNQTGVEWVVGRLSAEWRQILHNVLQPVLMVPQHPTAMTRALVAYNGLPRGRIALLVGAVLAIRWGVTLVVTSIGKPQVTADYLQEAGHFLESFGIGAEFVAADGNVEPNLLATLESHECDFLIMGGSRSNPLLEIFSGGTVERIIRKSSLPVLLCQ